MTFPIAANIRKATRAGARYLQTDPLFSTYWTPARDNELARLGELHHLAGAARVMRITSQKAAKRAKLLGLTVLTQEQASIPSKGEWIGAATRAAIAACVAPVHVLRGSKKQPHVYARWRAWQALLDENSSYCPKGIATIAGFNYSTVSNGLWRLKKLNEREAASRRSNVGLALAAKQS